MARKFPLEFTADQWAAVHAVLDASPFGVSLLEEDARLVEVHAKIAAQLDRLKELEAKSKLFVVRHYDGFDHDWIDVSKAVTKEEADRILSEKTDGGTRNTKYADIDYYSIFPADTRMLHSG